MANKVYNIELSQIKLPDYSEKIYGNCKYVRYGDDNLFPNFLADIAQSGIHHSIIESKIGYTYGEGLTLNGGNFSTKLFNNHPNPFETMNQIYYKIINDLIIFNQFAIEVIWSDKGTIHSIYHIPFNNIRCGRKNEFGQIDTYYYCEDWSKVYNYGYTAIDRFNPNKREGRQLIVYQPYIAGNSYYSLPDYIGVLNWICIDKEISNFHLANLRNGMKPSFILNFTNGEPSETEQQEIKEQIARELTGSDNGGKFLLTFNQSADKVPQLQVLQSDNLGEQFLNLEQSCLVNLIGGHRMVSPLLCGIRGQNGLASNTDELQSAFELLYNTVIKPYQNIIVSELNKILAFTTAYDGATYEPTVISPISFSFSESILSQILTKNELRDKIGYEPIAESTETVAVETENNIEE